jgi:L-fuconolactonase
MNRRAFLGTVVGAAAAASLPATIIDTHVHFYDPSRPQGVPWPPKNDPLLYRTVLPQDFIKITKPLGVTGAIKVEASAWPEDNQWVLDLAAKERVIVGVVGHLEPSAKDFHRNLARFHKNQLFRGIRSGRLQEDPELTAALKELASAGLELDAIGPPDLLKQLVRVTDQVPSLRVVINHMPFDMPTDAAARKEYESSLMELGHRPQVYAKVSNVLRQRTDDSPHQVDHFRPALEELWTVFGPDRLVYGSNWPVSERIAPYAAAFQVVTDYFTGKGQEALEKFYWKNSKAVYRW